MTNPPAVWRRLVDEQPEHVPHMVAARETAEIESELKELKTGARIDGGHAPLWQVLGDAHLTHDHRVTFVERDTVSLLASTPSEASLRGWAEHWYQKVVGTTDQ